MKGIANDEDEYMQLAMQLATYLANKAVLNIRIFSRRYHFRRQVFASTGKYIYNDTTDEEYPVCYKVNDAKTFKNLVYYVMLTNHQVYYYRLARLAGAFKIIAIDFQCFILSGIIRGTWILLFICKGSTSYIESYKPVRITQKEHLLIWNSETTQKPKHLSS